MRARLLLALLALACDGRAPAPTAAPEADARGFTAATAATAETNAAVARALPLADEVDFEEARRGLVASDPDAVVRAADGTPLWDPKDFGFVAGDAPASVNPSLWRQAKLNGIHGLFQVDRGRLPGARLRRLEHDAGSAGRAAGSSSTR